MHESLRWISAQEQRTLDTATLKTVLRWLLICVPILFCTSTQGTVVCRPGEYIHEGHCHAGKPINEGRCGPGNSVKDGHCRPGEYIRDGCCRPGKSVHAVRCRPGEYLHEGRCRPCMPGSDSKTYNAVMCEECPLGSGSLINSSACIVCQTGRYRFLTLI